MIVKFLSFEDKETVLEAARALKDKAFIVYQEYSQRAQAKRQELLPKLRGLCQKDIQSDIAYDTKEGAKIISSIPRATPILIRRTLARYLQLNRTRPTTKTTTQSQQMDTPLTGYPNNPHT